MIPLEPTHYYHVYNRANGSEKIFLTKNNYVFFEAKYKHYIGPFVKTYCYCLMPNHIHYLIQVKSIEEISLYLESMETNGEQLVVKFKTDPEKFISKQFSNLFSSYTQSFNKQQFRMGSLFMKNFKRKHVKVDSFLKKLVHYIHNNPVEAGLSDSPEGWMQSSYNAILAGHSECAQEVIDWFDNAENFRAFHKLPPSLDDEEY